MLNGESLPLLGMSQWYSSVVSSVFFALLRKLHGIYLVCETRIQESYLTQCVLHKRGRKFNVGATACSIS